MKNNRIEIRHRNYTEALAAGGGVAAGTQPTARVFLANNPGDNQITSRSFT